MQTPGRRDVRDARRGAQSGARQLRRASRASQRARKRSEPGGRAAVTVSPRISNRAAKASHVRDARLAVPRGNGAGGGPRSMARRPESRGRLVIKNTRHAGHVTHDMARPGTARRDLRGRAWRVRRDTARVSDNKLKSDRDQRAAARCVQCADPGGVYIYYKKNMNDKMSAYLTALQFNDVRGHLRRHLCLHLLLGHLHLRLHRPPLPGARIGCSAPRRPSGPSSRRFS